MSDLSVNKVREAIGFQLLRALVSLVLLTSTGCFGALAMHYDIQAYNKETLSSEEEMLLFNIGELHEQRPPHFMMLSEVDQSRSYTAGGGFQWTNLWNSIFAPSGGTVDAIANGSNTWQAGPFTAAASESPLYKINPIQGPDFANRFESPLTGKFTLFLDDQAHFGPSDATQLVMLFAQSLDLTGC